MWSLFTKSGKPVSPLKYSNGKTQEQVIDEILDHLKNERIVLFKGAVGTGKSVIALHLVKYFGKGHIVVPTKILEKQYHDDYTKRFYIKGLKIYYFMGKTNYRCKFRNFRVNCGHFSCPCSCPLNEGQPRLEVARVCPHYSPVVGVEIAHKVKNILEQTHLQKYKIYKYEAVRGEQAHILSPDPCEYFSMFKVYTDPSPHATIFNLAKWEIETWIGRKSKVPIEIIDEGDLFLDNLTYKVVFSKGIFDAMRTEGLVPLDKINFIEQKFRDTIQIVGYYDDVLGYNDFVIEFLKDFVDELAGISTSGTVCQMVERVRLILRYMYKSWCKTDKNKIIVYIPRPDLTLKALMERCGKLVLMSGTFQKEEVLREVFDIDPPIVEGETRYPGIIKLKVTGKEMDVTTSNWEKQYFKRNYWALLDKILNRAKKPCLVQVHAFKYVPNNVTVNREKDGILFSTVTDRGIDLKDEKCRSIVILKFPLPDLNDPVLKTMKKLLKGKFWKYYVDIAKRELVQQVGRGVRHKDDWVEVWTLDKRVLRELPKLWKGKIQISRVDLDGKKVKTLNDLKKFK